MERLNLDAAVRAGILRDDQADALRRFDENLHHAPSATEERFALVSGFADIMAAIGIALVAWTGVVVQVIFSPWVGLALPFLYWMAATHFTARRRMMLTSIVLLAGFGLSCAMAAAAVALFSLGKSPLQSSPADLANIWGTLVASATTGACWLYWRRFQLPIAFCAFAVAMVNVAINLFRLLVPGMPDWGVDLVQGLTGPALLVWAIWWDVSDVRRETIRSDVAFWLHIAAGFLVVKTAMTVLLGSEQASEGWWRLFSHPATPTSADAAAVLLVLGVFAVVSLIIDRRSLLTSGMFYAVPALIALTGGGALMFAPALFITGLCLIILAMQWLSWREKLLLLLPARVIAQLPRTQLKAVGPRPVF